MFFRLLRPLNGSYMGNLCADNGMHYIHHRRKYRIYTNTAFMVYTTEHSAKFITRPYLCWHSHQYYYVLYTSINIGIGFFQPLTLYIIEVLYTLHTHYILLKQMTFGKSCQISFKFFFFYDSKLKIYERCGLSVEHFSDRCATQFSRKL